MLASLYEYGYDLFKVVSTGCGYSNHVLMMAHVLSARLYVL